MITEKPVKPLLGFTRLNYGDLSSRGLAIFNGLSALPEKYKPTYDLSTFKDLLDRHSAAVTAALDGSSTAMAVRDQLRAELIAAMRQLGHYVESLHLDRAAFTATGFEAKTGTRSQVTEPPADSGVVGIEQGKTGELLVTVKVAARAIHYEVRYAAVVDGVVGAWSSASTTTPKAAVSITNLTPGRIYTFSVRATGHKGQTDWSETASRMCI